MGRSNGYTHGGSAGKNMALLLRAIFNIIGVALLFFGLKDWTFGDFSSIPLLGYVGMAICAVGLVVNLITPFFTKAK